MELYRSSEQLTAAERYPGLALRLNWPQAVTWGLIMLASVVSYLIARGVSRAAAQRAEHRGQVAKILARIEAIEEAAVDYWIEGRRLGEPVVCQRSHRIAREFTRLEYELKDLCESLCAADYTDMLIAFRKAVTAEPWQSESRVALLPEDPRIFNIGECADRLSSMINAAFNARHNTAPRKLKLRGQI